MYAPSLHCKVLLTRNQKLSSFANRLLRSHHAALEQALTSGQGVADGEFVDAVDDTSNESEVNELFFS